MKQDIFFIQQMQDITVTFELVIENPELRNKYADWLETKHNPRNGGIDIFMPADCEFISKTKTMVSLDIRARLLDEQGRAHHYWLASRSSTGRDTGLSLANSVAFFDANFRGVGQACVKCDNSIFIEKHSRLFQFIPHGVEYTRVTYRIVDELDETERGDGAFGSTGR